MTRGVKIQHAQIAANKSVGSKKQVPLHNLDWLALIADHLAVGEIPHYQDCGEAAAQMRAVILCKCLTFLSAIKPEVVHLGLACRSNFKLCALPVCL